MSSRNVTRDFIWIAIPALGIIVFFFTVLYLRQAPSPAVQIAFKVKRVEVLNAMRLALAAASEAQNGAVLATSEQDARSFFNDARSATSELDRGRIELQKMLEVRPDTHELELMKRVSVTLDEFQNVDKELLELAAQNSNRKAFVMAFGPAMKLLQEIDKPLVKIVSAHSDAATDANLKILQLAGDIRVGILNMQVLLAPHIAEVTEAGMDELEGQFTDLHQLIREKLAKLGEIVADSDRSHLATVTSRYAEFDALPAQIIKLSRANTNVRAVALALKQRRQAMLACQDALVAIQKAIQDEPLATTIPAGR